MRLENLLRVYLITVVVVGIIGAIAWWWTTGNWGKAMQVMISVFVVSCPCALGVAVPLAEELAASRAERLGVFVRTLGLWKKLCRVRQAVFDKTGTLTLENPLLSNPEALNALDAAQRAALRTLVTGNLHPVSRSLFDAIGPGDALPVANDAIEEIVGQGTRFTDAEGRAWALGRPGWQVKGVKGEIASSSSDTELTCDGRVLAAFSFRDALREDTVSEIEHLARSGVRPVVLSGDRRAKVEQIARQLSLPEAQWTAEMLPEQKAAWVREHDRDDTLYIGDGANDSLAFDAALCAGSPVTGRSFLERKADFYFLGHSMRFVSGLLRVARLHRTAVRRVFAFSVSYNLVTAAAGLAGHLNPLAAAILMPLSSVATLSIVALTFGRARGPASTAP
jgi:Cu2+-exporting ATPase